MFTLEIIFMTAAAEPFLKPFWNKIFRWHNFLIQKTFSVQFTNLLSSLDGKVTVRIVSNFSHSLVQTWNHLVEMCGWAIHWESLQVSLLGVSLNQRELDLRIVELLDVVTTRLGGDDLLNLDDLKLKGKKQINTWWCYQNKIFLLGSSEHERDGGKPCHCSIV